MNDFQKKRRNKLLSRQTAELADLRRQEELEAFLPDQSLIPKIASCDPQKSLLELRHLDINEAIGITRESLGGGLFLARNGTVVDLRNLQDGDARPEPDWDLASPHGYICLNRTSLLEEWFSWNTDRLRVRIQLLDPILPSPAVGHYDYSLRRWVEGSFRQRVFQRRSTFEHPHITVVFDTTPVALFAELKAATL